MHRILMFQLPGNATPAMVQQFLNDGGRDQWPLESVTVVPGVIGPGNTLAPGPGHVLLASYWWTPTTPADGPSAPGGR